MSENRNLFLAIALSVAVMTGYSYFFEAPRQEAKKAQAAIAKVQEAAQPAASVADVGAPEAIKVEEAVDRTATINMAERIQIKTPRLQGSLNLTGGRLDDLLLVEYHETTDNTSPNVVLMSPEKAKGAYFADFGWFSTDKTVQLPNANTVWTTTNTVLEPNSPVVLTWDNGQGLSFKREVSVDDQYMFKVTDSVINHGAVSVTVNLYSQVTRLDRPQTSGYMVLHEGPIGVLAGKLHEIDYDKLMDKKSMPHETTGGWLGITDKYWLVAQIPLQTEKVTTRFKGFKLNDRDVFQTEVVWTPETVAPGATATHQQHVFAGAKKLHLLDAYEAKLGFEKFDLAVDFGWFYFVTKPLFYVMEYLGNVFGNFGLAILILTVLMKIVFFPLANKSYRSMSRMKKIQPKVDALKERCGDDKMKMNQELMELYKKEKVNPISGCLPMLIQAPVFFCLYKVLFVTIEMRHAPFYGWIHDLSAPDPTTIFNLFGLLPFTPPSFLMIGIWPLIMGVTMVVQQRMNPQPADPVQAKMFMIMPVFMTVLLASFPAGLVIYWAWNNLLSMLQQGAIMRMDVSEPKVITKTEAKKRK